MIPILYESNEIGFSNNGICRLRHCISAIVTEERNGVYELDFDYPVGGANYEQIKCGRIVGVTHDEDGDIQPFEIVSMSRPIDMVVSFHAVHISYRQSQMTVSGTNVNSLAEAFTLLKTAQPSNPFSYESDFESTGYMASADGTPHSVRQMLGGVRGSILDTYGGEYEWDKWTVRLHRSRGEVKDFSIRYGVNLLEYDDETDYSGTFTSCIAYWKGEEGELVTAEASLNGLGYNGIDICIPLDLTEKFESAPTVEQLQNAALTYMRANNVNVPKQSIKVDFVRLSELGEYTSLQDLLACKLCDSIKVIFPQYEVEASFKIVRTEWNVLTDRYEGMELGSLRTTLAEALGVGQSSAVSSGGSGGGSMLYYGVCSTAAGTAAKEVTVTPDIGTPTEGTIVYVKFNNSNTVANPTINVNGTGAIAIKRYGTTAPSTSAASSWNAGSVVALMYDGTYWQMVGWINTTYSSMTDAEYQAGTSTTARLITPARLKAAIQYWSTAGTGTKSAFYGTCSTASATAQKDVTCGDWTLIAGNTISILFENSNTADAPTLNINGTGAKDIYRGNNIVRAINPLKWGYYALVTFVYDGTQYRYVSSETPAGFNSVEGGGAYYGTCSTADSTANKDVTVGTFDFTLGSIVAVHFTNANTADSPALKVDGDSSYRPIYRNGTVSSSTNPVKWDAGDTVCFMYHIQGPQNVFEYLGTSAEASGDVPVATSSTYGKVKVAGYYDAPGGYAEITTGNEPSVIQFPRLESVNNELLIRSKYLPDATTSEKGAVIVDDTMDGTSTNPVQNSVVKAYIDSQSGSGEANVLEGVQLNGTDLTITNKKVNIPLASSSNAGAMSSTDKSKLDGINLKTISRGGGSPSNPYVILGHDALSGSSAGGSDFAATTLTWLPYLVSDSTSSEYLKIPSRFLPSSSGSGISDVQIDGSSIVSNNVATIPTADGTTFGVVKVVSVSGSPIEYYLKIDTGQTGGNYPYKVPLLDSNELIKAMYLPEASTSTNGAMSSTDKTKLDGIPTPTSSDDGKVLSVSNGSWSLSTQSGGLNINYEGNTYPITLISKATVSGVSGVLMYYDDGSSGGSSLFFADGIGLNTVKTALETQIGQKMDDVSVTSSDNGKVMMVVNGTWQAVNLNLVTVHQVNATPSSSLGDDGDIAVKVVN